MKVSLHIGKMTLIELQSPKSTTLFKINQYSIYECTWYGIPKQHGPIINSLFDLKQEQKTKPLLMLNRVPCQSKTKFQDLDWYCMNYKCSLWQSVIHGRASFWSTVTHKALCQTYRPALKLKSQPTAKKITVTLISNKIISYKLICFQYIWLN